MTELTETKQASPAVPIRRWTARLRPDPYFLLLLATVVIGLLLPAHGTAVPVLDKAVTVAVGLLFFLYGARLAPDAVWRALIHWRLQLMVLLSTYGLFPLIGIGSYELIGRMIPQDIALGLLFLTLLPSTVQSSIAFTSIARGNVPAALCAASLSNLLGVFVTPMLVGLLFPAGSGGAISLDRISEIASQILLPFLAGMAVRPLIGAWIGRHKPVLTQLDRGAILLVIYAAFSAGQVAGVWSSMTTRDLAIVVALDALILAAVMTVITLVSRRLGLPRKDRIAILFCGSKKSLASGVPMAIILFPGAAASMIVVPLMLFHQTQLFVCAGLARRFAADDAAQG